MAFRSEHRSVEPPERWNDRNRLDEHTRKLAQTIKGLLRGQSNNHWTVTLEPDVTETIVPVEFARTGVAAVVSANNAAAAAEIASIYAVCEHGQVRITHPASAAMDRELALVLIG